MVELGIPDMLSLFLVARPSLCTVAEPFHFLISVLG